MHDKQSRDSFVKQPGPNGETGNNSESFQSASRSHATRCQALSSPADCRCNSVQSSSEMLCVTADLINIATSMISLKAHAGRIAHSIARIMNGERQQAIC